MANTMSQDSACERWRKRLCQPPKLRLAAICSREAVIGAASRGSEQDHRADALAFVHEVEGPVDLVQSHRVGDEGVERDLALLRHLDVGRQLGAAAHAA